MFAVLKKARHRGTESAQYSFTRQRIVQKRGTGLPQIRKALGRRRSLSETTQIDVHYEVHDSSTNDRIGTGEVPIAMQSFEVVVEWPLPGTVLWSDRPSTGQPWSISASALCKVEEESTLGCDDWLGQVLVLVDNESVTLKDILRATVNTEGAHAVDVSLDSSHRPVHVASAITIAGVRYNHIIAIEAALYLYEALVLKPNLRHADRGMIGPRVDIEIEVDGSMVAVHEQLVDFFGSFVIPFGTGTHEHKHRIRGPK